VAAAALVGMLAAEGVAEPAGSARTLSPSGFRAQTAAAAIAAALAAARKAMEAKAAMVLAVAWAC
jgi:hypothetical protein